ncbi:hypothetical protein HPB47_007444 [Ixodes persulcatus]|uniref:Uncharacterized protein n=1 Tax=Ixodes persulcatus TaxID=34615 RepID=A0AC60P8C2_IXOPE|nr:hypothetical protein HPB47_007444 [Ixodes persulcatus]
MGVCCQEYHLIHHWANHRYGVFAEHASSPDKALYCSHNKMEATRCTEEIGFKLSDATGSVCPKNDACMDMSDLCSVAFHQEKQPAPASIMFLPYLNGRAKTKQRTEGKKKEDEELVREGDKQVSGQSKSNHIPSGTSAIDLRRGSQVPRDTIALLPSVRGAGLYEVDSAAWKANADNNRNPQNPDPVRLPDYPAT